MYDLEIKENEKIFLITMSDLAAEKENLDYIGELKKNINNINPIQYNVVVDSRKLSNTQYAIVGKLMQFINDIPFKHIKVLC